MIHPFQDCSIGHIKALRNSTRSSPAHRIGWLRIISDPKLTNLVGLGGFSKLGGVLEIRNNTSLKNLDGLPALTSIGLFGQESLIIRGNPELRNLEALRSLTSIPGGVEISFNASLQGLEGLESVTKIGGTPFVCCPQQLDGTFRITNNESLKSIDALAAVTSVHHGIFITDNPSLKNLDGFSSLTEITISGAPGTNPPARLEIRNNAALANVDGLSSLTSMGGSNASLTVTDNSSLVRCCGLYSLIQNGLGCSPQPSCATITISGNGAGCTKEDILAGGACRPGDVQSVARTTSRSNPYEPETESGIWLSPNPSNGEFDLEVVDDFFGSCYVLVRDFSGRAIKEEVLVKDGNVLKARIDMKPVSSGLYILTVRKPNGILTNKKLIIKE